MALLLANLRSKFAEFLNNASPVRLGAFTPVYQCRFAVRLLINLVSLRIQLGAFPGGLNTTDQQSCDHLLFVVRFHLHKVETPLRIYQKRLASHLNPNP